MNPIQSIRPRHHLILQYAFNGLSNVEIASKTGLCRATVGCILRSPAARAEIARMTAIAVEKSTNIPARVALHQELTGAAVESVRINRALQRDPLTRIETRVKIGQHFMDRVIFDKRNDGDEDKMSYRDILRKLDKIEARVNVNDIVESLPIQEVGEILDPGYSGIDSDQNMNHRSLELVDGGLGRKRIIDVSDPD